MASQTQADVEPAAAPSRQRFENSEDPLGDFQPFLFHSRQRGARHVFASARSGEAPLLQDEVIVGAGVHGVKNVGIIGNLQFCEEKESD